MFRITERSKRTYFPVFVYSKYRRERKTSFSYTRDIEEKENLLFRIPKYRREKKTPVSYTGQYTKSGKNLVFDILSIRNQKEFLSSIFQVYEIKKNSSLRYFPHNFRNSVLDSQQKGRHQQPIQHRKASPEYCFVLCSLCYRFLVGPYVIIHVELSISIQRRSLCHRSLM